MARTTPTRRAVDGAALQEIYEWDGTATDYRNRKAWKKKSAGPCPYCPPSADCQLARLGTYPRVDPPGTKIARFRCRRTRKTVSYLPDCFATRVSGPLERFEEGARAVAPMALI